MHYILPSDPNIPPGKSAYTKLINSEAYTMEYYVSHGSNPWIKNNRATQSVGEVFLSEQGYNIPNISGINRPSFLPIPLPRPFSFLLYYSNSSLNLNGTVTYSLNTSYKPHKDCVINSQDINKINSELFPPGSVSQTNFSSNPIISFIQKFIHLILRR